MSMKRAAFVVIVAFIVAGCSKQQPEATSSNGSTAASGTSEPAQHPAATRRLKEALPEGVELGFRHRILSDQIAKRSNRPDRRRIGLEYLEGGKEDVFSSIDHSLVAAGFVQRERKDQGNGSIRAKFAKARFGTVIVTVAAAGEPAGGTAKSAGRVQMDWPVRKE